jgi:ligand-binding SRPBCC domain-containing protein
VPAIRLETEIDAPAERVFDLARSVDLHVSSMNRHRERAVGGVTSGLIGAGEEVTWRARHLGLWHELSSRIAEFDPPRHFRDTMSRGPFVRFDHDHFFAARRHLTVMTDVFDYTAPWGVIGRVADAVFLKRYLERLLTDRARAIKEAAEGGLH